MKLFRAHEDPVHGIMAQEAKVSQNLIVPTSSSVELLRSLTDHVGHRHILFVNSPIKLFILNVPLYFLQTFENGVSVARAYQTLNKEQ